MLPMMRLEDAISVTPHIHSGAEYVRGQKNKGDEARLRHLKNKCNTPG